MDGRNETGPLVRRILLTVAMCEHDSSRFVEHNHLLQALGRRLRETREAADLSVVVPAVRQRIVSGDVTLLRAELPDGGPALLRAAVGLEPSGPTD